MKLQSKFAIILLLIVILSAITTIYLLNSDNRIAQNQNSTGSSLTSQAQAINFAKKDPDFRLLMEEISKSPKGYGYSYNEEAWLSEQASGMFYGDIIQEKSQHWYVRLIFCAKEWDDNNCGCQGDFAVLTTRVSQDTGQILISRNDPPRKIIDLKEGAKPECD